MARWIRALVAILSGNAVYFYLLAPRLPDRMRHRPFAFDAGLLLDFGICAAIYLGLGRLASRRAGRARPGKTNASIGAEGRSRDWP